jgi:uncharacterized protein with HEPN domain
MELAVKFTAGMKFGDFSGSVEIQYAVVRCLEIIGEAVRNIPDSLREKHPDIPWRDMVGMRNKIAHGYFDINLKTVWKVVKEELPAIVPALKRIIDDMPDGNGH